MTEEIMDVQKAVMLDMQVRTGTANVMQQRQWCRTMYSGSALCECNLSLSAKESVKDSNEYQFLCLTTSGTVKVTFMDAEQTIHSLAVSKVLVLDSYVSDIVVANEGSEVVTVNMTKLK